MCSLCTALLVLVLCVLACCSVFVAGQGSDDNPRNLRNYPDGQQLSAALVFYAAGDQTYEHVLLQAFQVTFGGDHGAQDLVNAVNAVRTGAVTALEEMVPTTELRETAVFDDLLQARFGEGFIGNVRDEVFDVVQHHRQNMGAGHTAPVVFRQFVHDAVTRFEGTEEAPTDLAATTLFTQPMLNLFVDRADLFHPDDLATLQANFAVIATPRLGYQHSASQLSWAHRDSQQDIEAAAQKKAAQRQNAHNRGSSSSSSSSSLSASSTSTSSATASSTGKRKRDDSSPRFNHHTN